MREYNTVLGESLHISVALLQVVNQFNNFWFRQGFLKLSDGEPVGCLG